MVYKLNYRPECLEVAILASKVASTLNFSTKEWAPFNNSEFHSRRTRHLHALVMLVSATIYRLISLAINLAKYILGALDYLVK